MMGLDLTGLGSIADLAGKVLDKVMPDPVEAARLKLEIAKAEQDGRLSELKLQADVAMAQAATNNIEAASNRLFVAGWRPFVGWTCGFAFAYKFVLAPAVVLVLTVSGTPVTLPVLDFTEMSTILLGMLGLGGLRTLEKVKGAA